MKTYQDLQEVVQDQSKLKEFLIAAITDHKGSKDYRLAKLGAEYDRQQNRTIMLYRKFLYTMSGQAIPDNFSANHKIPSNFYKRFNLQENQYLLGNGVDFEDNSIKDKLGTKKKAFDTVIQKLGKLSLTQGEAFGFWDLDHIEPFEFLEFVPIYDEEDGALKAGIRFWQIAEDKPLRITFYEIDGFTEYIKRKGDKDLEIYQEKRPYILKTRTNKAGDIEIYDGENYPGFPIVPLWGNQDHICNIEAWQMGIDCYDLIKSGFCNDIDDATQIYWIIKNAGGMDDVDLAKFLQHMKTVHAAQVSGDEGGADAEAHTIDIPVEARETILNRIEKDLIKDAMALDTDAIAEGNTVATAIRAAYEALDEKTNDFEYCVIEFIQGILELAGLEGDPTFKRSKIVNQTEETNMVLAAAQYLDTETILKHLPFLSTDELSGIMDNLTREEANRFVDEDDEGEE